MNAALVLLSILGVSSAQILGIARIHDDGQWKPALDGSVLGSGAINWLGADLDDGQWRPHLDNSLAGVSPSPLVTPLVHHIYRRSVGLINPNALPVPADTLNVALAKQAQLIQQNTEGTRNILGGGIPLHLPADTPEVAIGKQAHAIAHESQKAITHGVPLATSVVAAPIAARIATPWAASTWAASPLAYSAIHPWAAGVRALW